MAGVGGEGEAGGLAPGHVLPTNDHGLLKVETKVTVQARLVHAWATAPGDLPGAVLVSQALEKVREPLQQGLWGLFLRAMSPFWQTKPL